MSVDQRVKKAATLLAFLAVGAILYFGAVAFIPVALALFFALLLSPAVDALHRLRVPRTLAAALVMLVLLLLGAAIVDGISAPAKEWFARAPQTIRKIEQRIRPVRSVIAQVDAVKERAGQLAEGPHAAAPVPATTSGSSSALEMTQSLLEAITVIPLTLFFLAGGPPLLARMAAALSGSERSAACLRVTEAIRAELGRYFGTIALINLGLGLATAAVMALLGMPNALLWGTVAAVLNFVPFVGPMTTLGIVAVAALVTFNSVGQALAVPGAFLGLHLIESQLVQPLFVGHRLEVSALIILLTVWFGFWFWGIPGIMLAVPLLVALKAAAEHLEGWRPVLEFLSPNPQWRPIRFTRPDGAASPRASISLANRESCLLD
ncbi:MAG TPA: AI-2E family transporter [Steroidobacteraceae bacterium]|nr:AI-2E family transporter [Steroidobacteraceae bacterium]